MPNDGGDLPDRGNTNIEYPIQEISTVPTFEQAKPNQIMVVVVVVILFGGKRLPLGRYILPKNI